MLRFDENPPMRTPTATSVAEMSGNWWVAHTKARFEKALAFDLTVKGIGYFLPMVERIKMSGGRKRRLLLPLFPSYLFFCGDADSRYAALATNRLCQAIAVTDREKFVDELTGLERALASHAHLDLYPFAAVGRRCRVRIGPLQGIIGTVIRRDNETRLVLQVSMLGQGASLEIDTDLLEPAE
jgi:hypothetical protein